MPRAILYTVLFIGGLTGGYLFGQATRAGNESAPEIATLTPLAEQAAVHADHATAAGKDVTLPDTQGQDRALSEWDGKPRLINFWATWCAPCRQEIPLLKALQAANEPTGLQVLGIAFDEPDAVAAYAEEMSFNYPVLVGEQGALDVAEAYNLELMALPFTLLVGSDGALIKAEIGEIDEQEAANIVRVMTALESQTISLEEARNELAH